MADPTPPTDFWIAIVSGVAALSGFMGALLMRLLPAVLTKNGNGKKDDKVSEMLVTEVTCKARSESTHERIARLEKLFDDNSKEVKSEFHEINKKLDDMPGRIMEQIKMWGRQ